jgi:3-methyladenine DNA glycosylase AlkD
VPLNITFVFLQKTNEMNLQQQIENDLRLIADEGVRDSARRFFKEHINCLGVNAPGIKNIAKRYVPAVKAMERSAAFSLCEQLLATGIHEEMIISGIFSYAIRKTYVAEDFFIFERWIKEYVTNWAVCDGFCNKTMGAFLLQFPGQCTNLFNWAHSENRWVRRAAAVSFIDPARKGKYLEEMLHIAGLLLLDTDDMVQKGYGWMLKVAASMHEDEVFNFITAHKAVMPRTALRYAIEKMPESRRQQAMSK